MSPRPFCHALAPRRPTSEGPLGGKQTASLHLSAPSSHECPDADRDIRVHHDLPMTLTEAARDFLAQRRIAVVGVSRNSKEPANYVFRRQAAARGGCSTVLSGFPIRPGCKQAGLLRRRQALVTILTERPPTRFGAWTERGENPHCHPLPRCERNPAVPPASRLRSQLPLSPTSPCVPHPPPRPFAFAGWMVNRHLGRRA